MKIRQQRTIEKKILRSQMSLMIRQESFMRNTTKILSNIIKTNMERKSK